MKTYEESRAAARLAATLPTDHAALLARAMDTVISYNAAVVASDEASAMQAADEYEAIIWSLNGGTSFGSMDRSNPKAGGIVAEAHCRAAAGTVPMWGQSGEFLVTVDAVRVRVVMSDGFGAHRYHFGLYAIDIDAPFLSETGYRSHFGTSQAGYTVEEIAIEVVRGYLADWRGPIARDARKRLAAQKTPHWLPVRQPTQQVYEDKAGQFALAF